jgi:hypothetical protein
MPFRRHFAMPFRLYYPSGEKKIPQHQIDPSLLVPLALVDTREPYHPSNDLLHLYQRRPRHLLQDHFDLEKDKIQQ